MKLSQLLHLIKTAMEDYGDMEVCVLGADGSSRPDIDICVEYDEADKPESLILCDSITSEELLAVEEALKEYDEDLLN